ncbi:hypothetical protein D3C78_940980 [compost metagenome]
MRTHPQEQRLFILFNGFVIEERERTAGVQSFVIEQTAATVHYACQDKFKSGTRRQRRLLASKQLQPARTDITFTKQHQTDTFFRAEQRGVQALNQTLGWPFTQHGDQADALFRLPGKFNRLPLQLLPETVAVQRITRDTCTDHRHQRQALTQTEFARQTGFVQRFERAIGHFCGVAELQ